MKKRFLFVTTLLSIFAFSLTSCNQSNYVPTKVYRSEYINDFYTLGIKGDGRKTLSYTVETEENSEGEIDTYRAVTDVNVLVVPIDFTDYPASSLPGGADNAKHQIEIAHFGDPEVDSLYSDSLKSYYYESSLGMANITGSVAEWYHTGMSVTEFSKYSGGKSGATLQLTADIQEYMRNEYEAYKTNPTEYMTTHDTVPLNLKDFDANNDGYVDALIMIYSCPPRVTVGGKYVDNDLYWAYTSVRPGAFGTVANPAFYGYFWTSIETFYEAGYYDENEVHHEWTEEEKANGTVALDCHTLIHEFGHILGLPDYYSYDANSGGADYYPMGGVDMM
ncbi:MAG: immune inhibitor A domain-containing protein, partial [Bacilli bacterium]